MILYIPEKPSVANAIADELGRTGRTEHYIQCGEDFVAPCVGHLFEMAEPHHYDERYKVWREADLPFIPTEWKLIPKDQFRDKLKAIAQLVKRADRVVHAGDPDREGQLLVEEVLEYCGNTREVLRYWANATDPVSVRRALGALTPNTDKQYLGMRLAAEARGKADQLIGVNFSRAYTLRAKRGGSQNLLTVGRVQTPTLALVVRRDREIESFKSVSYYSLAAVIQHSDSLFKAKWKPQPGQVGIDGEGRLISKPVAQKLVSDCTGQYGTVREFTHEPKDELHPRCYSLSDITLEASNRFGMTAEEVLKACQNLYETHKLTSYPRTDCGYLPEAQHADAEAVFAALRHVHPGIGKLLDGADSSIKSKSWDDSKITAHHGIIPTQHKGDVTRLSEQERQVYELIIRAYIAQFYPAHGYMSTVINIEIQGETFVATGKTVTRNGWKDVYRVTENDEGDGEEIQALPQVRQGARVKCEGIEAKAQKTKPPSRFTEGTLGKAMENIHKFVTDPDQRKLLRDGDGIGTSATRAKIISELKRRGFLAVNGRYVVSTDLGRGLVDALPSEVTSPSLTAFYERMLKQIEAGSCTVDGFLTEQIGFVRAFVKFANSGNQTIAGTLGPTCPLCGDGHLRRVARKDGAGYFWGCDRYADGCKTTFEDKNGKPDLPSKTYTCPVCTQGFLRKIDGNKGPFWGCSRYADGCRTTFLDAKGKPVLQKP